MSQLESSSKEKVNQHAKDSIIDFTAGCLGGIAIVYVGQPFDTIKVKMQAYPSLYKNMGICFKEILKTDGVVRGLYAGTTPALITNIAENSVLFLCYGLCQKFIHKIRGTKDVKDLTTLENASAGFLASFFSSIVICPTELIKCKMQAMHEEVAQGKVAKQAKGIGPINLTATILRQEGFRGLFRGLVPTLVREMPGYFLFFGGYEGTREWLRRSDQSKDEIGLLKTMIAGSVGGAVFWISTYPFDVVKSRVQISGQSINLAVALIQISRTEGFLALYNGLIPTMCRTVPATAALFVTYEYSKKFLHNIF